MQRIIRSPLLYSALNSDVETYSKILREVCPAQLANLFASSRCGSDGQLEWWSPLKGSVIPFLELSVVEQQQLLKVLAQRKAALAYRAEELAGEGQPNVAQMIRTLLSDTDFSNLYSIDQQPVVIEWQAALQGDRMQLQTIAPSAADSAAVVMAASAAKSVRTSRTVKPAKRRLLWLLILSLLALACAALML